jgi:BirA family biotin operon repressor/biotin-[acetyl-CoA-carboxylase] ligase
MIVNVERLQESLRTKRFGKNIIFLREVDSTNDLAKELAGYGAVEGTVVVAETQTTGRGRLGREWFSPVGGLWFSVVLRPALKPEGAVRLVFVACLAVAEVLRELYGLKSETKWPNDVLVKGRKVCGMLTEMNTTGEKVNYVIVGVGVNANFDVKKTLPEGLWDSATALEAELGRKVRLEELFRALLEKLEDVYDQFLKEGFNPILDKWKTYAGFLGYRVDVTNETEKFSGLALDVDNEGALVLRLENGTIKRVFVGDVTLRSR